MILTQDVLDAMRSELDAEGADHYSDTLDLIPAINNSVRWLVAVVNATLGQKKPGEEILRDLSYADVFRTSQDSRISLDSFRYDVWTINSVEVLPVTGTTGAATPGMANNKDSYYRPDLYHIRPTKSTKRLTPEEWTISTIENPFAPGYDGDSICDGLKEYAYLNPVTYNPDFTTSIAREIEISPILNKQLVTVFYAKTPTVVTIGTNFIEFPESVFQLILARALSYVAVKQGDGTTLFTITQADINMLLQTIN